MPASKQTQGCALEVQMSSIGLKSGDPSKDGKRIEVKAGLDSPRVNSGVPQVEQKVRVVCMPLLARTEYVFGVPTILRSELKTTTPEANGAPLER
jgi:hypothetical protein